LILSKAAEIERFIRRPPDGLRAVVLHGRDRSGVRERADRLAAYFAADPDDPFDVARLTEADLDADPARLEDELSALSLMGGRRLVRLRLGEKAGPTRLAAETLTRHAQGSLNPDAVLLIEAPALDRASPLRKASEAKEIAAACAALVIYDDEAGDVSALVREALQKDRVTLTPEALSLFVSRLPKDRGVARQEVERLILYLGPGRPGAATPGDLEDFLGVEPEASLFDAASDAFGGKLREAQAGLRRARAEGEGGPAAVRALSGHAARLRRARILVDSGTDAAAAAKACGVFWKQEREFLRQLRGWRADDLEALAGELLVADRACKTSGSPDDLIAERLAMTVAGRARRLGL
jgi:DNA polymerase-3 subunit delta